MQTLSNYALPKASSTLESAAFTAHIRPCTWTGSFGLITEALARRRERGLAPFTVVSCDNVEAKCS